MITKFYLIHKDANIIFRKKEKKYNYFVSDKNIKFTAKEVYGKEVLIKCAECGKEKKIKMYGGKHSPLKRKFLCDSCRLSGERNPFFGKKHSEEFKGKLSNERKGIWFLGKENPMYGINVWKYVDENKEKDMRKNQSKASSGYKNGFYGKTHSQKTREHLSKIHKIRYLNDPSLKEKSRIQAIKNLENNIFYKKTSIEKKIENIIKEYQKKYNFDYKYNKILHRKYQYDFILGEDILLEIHGDYWHANPIFYGQNKKELTSRQKYKVEKDKEKKDYAHKYGYKIYYFWENNINHNIEDIKEKIEGIIKNAFKIRID